MKMDIVRPQGNEAELELAAKTLGFSKIVFLYTQFSSLPSVKRPSIKGITIKSAFFVNNINEIGKAMNRVDYIFAPAERQFFESKKVDFVVGAENAQQKDFFYQKRAGLDDAMLKLAKQNGITVIFDSILSENKIGLGRLQQNARLCRRHKVAAIAATFASNPMEMRSANDLAAFCRVIKLN